MPDLAVYDEMFGRSRRHAVSEPPTLHSDLCGYEYAGFYPGMGFYCSGCFEPHVAQDHISARVHVAYTDLSQAFGRRHEQLGIACSEACAGVMFERWKADHA